MNKLPGIIPRGVPLVSQHHLSSVWEDVAGKGRRRTGEPRDSGVHLCGMPEGRQPVHVRRPDKARHSTNEPAVRERQAGPKYRFEVSVTHPHHLLYEQEIGLALQRCSELRRTTVTPAFVQH